jgi:hypothetical protein
MSDTTSHPCPDTASRWLSPPEVAKLFGIAPEKVVGAIRRVELRACNLGNGSQRPRYRISTESLEDFLRSREVGPAPQPVRRRRVKSEHTWY